MSQFSVRSGKAAWFSRLNVNTLILSGFIDPNIHVIFKIKLFDAHNWIHCLYNILFTIKCILLLFIFWLFS